MAKRSETDEDKKPKPEEADGDEDTSNSDESEEEESDEDESEQEDSDTSDADESDESEESESEEDEDESDKAEEDSAEEDSAEEDEDEDDDKGAPEKDETSDEGGEPLAASGETDGEEEDEILPAQLGAQRYVYSAFFAATILMAFILGRAFETAWAQLAINTKVVSAVPAIASYTDDSKQTYSFIAGGVIAVVVALVQFRKESVRKWADEVAGELVKVKWPNRKEVYGSTIVVVATSAIAVTYLFLLDRFWGFVTNLIYGAS